MSNKVVLIGLEPTKIDLSDPAYAAFAHLDANQIQAGLDRDVETLNSLGYEASLCLTSPDPESAIADVSEHLTSNQYDCVLIGDGGSDNRKKLLII